MREPDRFVVLQTFAAERLRRASGLLRPHVFRHDQLRVLSNRFSGRVAEEALGGGIPERDETLEGFSDDGVFRRLDDAVKEWRRRYQVWHRRLLSCPVCYRRAAAKGLADSLDRNLDSAKRLQP